MLKKTESRSTRRAAAVTAWLLVCACSRGTPESELIWHVGTTSRGATGGDLLAEGRATWIAYEDGGLHIRIVHVDPRRTKAPAQVKAMIEGASPSLARAADGTLVLAHMVDSRIALRRARDDGRNWSAPEWIDIAPATRIASDRLAIDAAGTWWLPAARDSSHIILLRSQDGGATWDQRTVADLPAAADPALAACGGRLHLVARTGVELVHASSSDGGMTWSPFTSIVPHVEPAPHALASDGGNLRLAWTDAAPDSSAALPLARALRVATSQDSGRTWSQGVPIVWRAGSVPARPALAVSDAYLTVLFADRSEHAGAVVCLRREVDAFPNPPAAAALRLWTGHTLARPVASQRLFIEGYFMRGLIAAHTALRRAPEFDVPLDTRAGLQRAVDFADWMLRGQNEHGYWPLGYKAVYVADMAAVVALYADLTPHLEPQHAERYVHSAEVFAAALQRDGMILPSGAVGIGWPATRSPSESTAVRAPYLVSTSLAGIGVHAWLYARTRNPLYRARALAALDYTLQQIQPDGSFPGIALDDQVEGAYLIAAYVQEGWMAADACWPDDTVRDRLRRALPAHVDWLVRTQRADGTWSSGADGEYARTPPIIAFLMWYERRCAHHTGARAAVERAAAALTDPDRWPETGILRAGKHEEVLRALAGRPLAGLVP